MLSNTEELQEYQRLALQAKQEKDNAYKERDMLVSLLSKWFPAWLERHPESDATWEDDWRWIVFVKLPTGQASWHIHDSELPWFDHLPRRGDDINSWDGHTTEEKYQRVLSAPNRCLYQEPWFQD